MIMAGLGKFVRGVILVMFAPGVMALSNYNAGEMCAGRRPNETSTTGTTPRITVSDTTVIKIPANQTAGCELFVSPHVGRFMTLGVTADDVIPCGGVVVTYSGLMYDTCRTPMPTFTSDITVVMREGRTTGSDMAITLSPFHYIRCTDGCVDDSSRRHCSMWAKDGDCQRGDPFYKETVAKCRLSCGLCVARPETCCYSGAQNVTHRDSDFAICDTYKCISTSQVCDGYRNCEDGSDEFMSCPMLIQTRAAAKRAQDKAKRAEANAKRAEENAKRAEENATAAEEQARSAEAEAIAAEQIARGAEADARRAENVAKEAEARAGMHQDGGRERVDGYPGNDTEVSRDGLECRNDGCVLPVASLIVVVFVVLWFLAGV